MYKPELLAPAGDLNTLKVAIEAGADAVYIGGKNFGARYFATNFSDDDMIEAVKFAHQRLKKVYVTVNTIVYDNEFNDLEKYIDFLYRINVDAIIVQDLGVISFVNNKYPDFEIHASTQMNVFNDKAINILKNLNVKRVVLARETPFEVIKQLTNMGMEIEVFIHGALCFSSSGNCLMSYSIGNRSGNRGKCAQPCRKKYSLFENDKKILKEKAILSMKDLCTIDNIDKLIDIKVTSFKIEGRMKSSEYVYSVVKSYRKAIDNKLYNTNYNLTNDIKDMKIMFNRYFTKGYLFNEQNNEITNINSVNHQGILIGKVVCVNKNSIEIKLEDDLYVQDAIRIKTNEEIGFNVQIMFVNGDKRNIAKKGEIVKIPFITTNKVLNKDVLLTKSERIRQELKDYLKTEHIKTPLNATLTIKINENASLFASDGFNEVIVYSDECITNILYHPNDDEFYKDKLNKLTDTPFYFNEIVIDNDNIAFISIKTLNEMRRKMVELLLNKRLLANKIGNNRIVKKENKCNKLSIQYETIVHTKEQYDACVELGIKTIYTDYDSNLNNVSRLSDTVYNNQLVHNIGQIGNHVTTSPYFNVVNKESAILLNNLGADKVYLSYETEIDQMPSFNDCSLNIGMPIYGKMDVMITKHCMISKSKGYLSKGCNACIKNNYYMVDEYNNKFTIFTEPSSNCNIRIIDYKIFDIIDKVEYLKNKGINLFLFTFTTESYQDVKKILSKVI